MATVYLSRGFEATFPDGSFDFALFSHFLFRSPSP